MLRVIEYFTKSLKVIQSDTPEYVVCKSLHYTVSSDLKALYKSVIIIIIIIIIIVTRCNL